MRQICLDTETTGMHALGGDRIVEIGCVGIFGRTLSDKENTMFHVYINPERDVPEEVVRVHGLTTEFLSDKPVFADIVDDFLAFIEGAELIIHNAEFDVGFLNAELKRLGKGTIEAHCAAVTDSLEMAKKMFPGLRNNLDRLCDRFELDMAQADKIVESLSSPVYRAQPGTNGGFILMHSVGSIPHGSSIDVPLNYADYYFLEALLRKRKIEEGIAPVE